MKKWIRVPKRQLLEEHYLSWQKALATYAPDLKMAAGRSANTSLRR